MKNFRIVICILLFPIVIPVFAFSEDIEPEVLLSTYDEIREEIRTQAELYITEGNYQDAVDYLDNIIDKYPSLAAAYYFRGIAHYCNNELMNADASLRETLELNPYYAEAYYYLALVAYRKGNTQQVIEYLNQATLLDITFQKAYYNKGITFLSLNMPKRAIKEFAYSLYLKPTDSASLVGILEAGSQLDMLEINQSGGRKHARISLGNSRDTVALPLLESSDMEYEKTDSLEMLVSTPSGKRRMTFTRGNPIELNSSISVQGIVEINFDEPKNFKNKSIQLRVKGVEGGEKIGIVLRDSKAQISPIYQIEDIEKTWKSCVVNINSIADTIDLNSIEYIGLELLLPQRPGMGDSSSVLIKDIKFM